MRIDADGNRVYMTYEKVRLLSIPDRVRPFYIKFEQDHNGQTWTVQKAADYRDDSDRRFGIIGNREQMRWLVSELSRMLDGSPDDRR